MVSLPLLRGAGRLQIVAARKDFYFRGGSATRTTLTSSCNCLDHRFHKVGGEFACTKARGRYVEVYRFEVRNHPSSVRNGPMRSKKAPAQKEKPPSVLEVQRAIGIVDDTNEPDKRTNIGGSSSFIDLLSSNPIGQAESSVERKIRETAEWVVVQTESGALHGQKTILVVCMMIFPLWVFLLLVASGIIQLPFNSTFLDNLLS